MFQVSIRQIQILNQFLEQPENIKLDSKTLFEDNAQLWQYGLWSLKSGDTPLVRLESKL